MVWGYKFELSLEESYNFSYLQGKWATIHEIQLNMNFIIFLNHSGGTCSSNCNFFPISTPKFI